MLNGSSGKLLNGNSNKVSSHFNFVVFLFSVAFSGQFALFPWLQIMGVWLNSSFKGLKSWINT